MDWLDGLLGWFGVSVAGLGLGTGVAWFFGLMPILGAAAQVVAAAVAPVVGAVVSGMVWVWQNILWPGIWRFASDILDDWVTVLGFVMSLGVLWFVVATPYKVRIATAERRLDVCTASLAAAKRRAPPVEEPRVELPWPFRW